MSSWLYPDKLLSLACAPPLPCVSSVLEGQLEQGSAYLHQQDLWTPWKGRQGAAAFLGSLEEERTGARIVTGRLTEKLFIPGKPICVLLQEFDFLGFPHDLGMNL